MYDFNLVSKHEGKIVPNAPIYYNVIRLFKIKRRTSLAHVLNCNKKYFVFLQ